jgi:two-component system, OmpR family, sensor histidine kinase KdpD
MRGLQWATRQLRSRTLQRHIVHILLAIASVAAVTVVLEVIGRIIDLRQITIVYLIPVLITASQWGVVAGVVAAIAAVGFSAFLFYPPLFSFQVTNTQQVIDLSVFIFVAVVTSQLANSVKRQAEIARRRENETRDLYAFSRRLAGGRNPADIHAAIRDHLSAMIPRRTVLIGAGNEAEAPPVGIPEAVVRAAEHLMNSPENLDDGSIVDDGSGNFWLVRSVSGKTLAFGVVAIDLGSSAQQAAGEVRRRVDAILAEATETLERLDLAHAIGEAKMRSETETLREALIGSVSHELRTPLASIMGAATVLAQSPAITGDKRADELVGVVRSEAERLNNDIQNLLDATRISSAGVRPRQNWVDPGDIVNTAVSRRQRRLAGHKVVLDVDSELPLVYVDPGLLEQAFGQMLDNAAKYSPPGSTISVKAEGSPTTVKMSVTDQGVGLSGDERTRLWERFFRGERHAAIISGSGLGLWIASAFVAANGGRMEASSAGADKGTTVSIILPVPQEALPEPVADDE